MDEYLEKLIERRNDISYALIEASGEDYRELELELEEINAEIEALGGEIYELNGEY
jgi:tetrahydromethanopterin S-methyltransferase subunit G